MKDYKWITYFMVGSVAVGVAVTVGVLVAYGMNLGAISSSAADWGNFGSVLSGAFTLLGSVTTFGTLVFLLIQQRRNEENQRAQETQRQEAQDKHDKVISRQLEAQTFEQYLKHREVFFDRLESLEATFNHTVRFTNKDALYQSIFPRNCPTHCSYDVDLSSDQEQAAGLGQLHGNLLELRGLMRTRPFQDGQGFSIIDMMWRIRQQLHIAYLPDAVDGDISLGGVNLGINLYALRESLEVIVLTVNSILFYSGNKEVEPFDGALKDLVLRRAMIAETLGFRFSQNSYRVRKDAPGLVELEQFYRHILQLPRALRGAAFEKICGTLDVLFGSKHEVGKLSNYRFFNSVLKSSIRLPMNDFFAELDGQEEPLVLLRACQTSLDLAWRVSYRADEAEQEPRLR
ncbi:hypothetical protein [Pseudomonas vanderleydeniana]|uniref:Phage abortive infection protein n=1 Tax=Pseudomonas vanderleydeniana TaxID=2745495 RepID=A0A9E6PHF6_9PSED|nr:hypothetical protein [Pseudomonas vanderleydeniana]QXI26514.1 hypothetical protein HU752_021610 [Pseudomonas vanderleydeniana]